MRCNLTKPPAKRICIQLYTVHTLQTAKSLKPQRFFGKMNPKVYVEEKINRKTRIVKYRKTDTTSIALNARHGKSPINDRLCENISSANETTNNTV